MLKFTIINSYGSREYVNLPQSAVNSLITAFSDMNDAGLLDHTRFIVSPMLPC